MDCPKEDLLYLVKSTSNATSARISDNFERLPLYDEIYN